MGYHGNGGRHTDSLIDIYKHIPAHGTAVVVDHLSEEDELIVYRELKKDGPERYTCRPLRHLADNEFLARRKTAMQRGSEVRLAIRLKESGDVVGRILLFDFNPRNRSVEIGYYTRRSHRRRGHAREALELILQILFARCELNKVYAQTAETNRASIGLLASLGFSLDGVLREHHEIDGRLFNDHVYSLLCREFRRR